MPENNSTRHKSSVALILVDVVNHFEFPDGDTILKNALPIAGRLAKFKQRCRRSGIPAIYVNDNFGQWHSDAKNLVSSCLASDCAGRPFVETLRPDDEDYFVLKPMHWAFFQTPLEILLHYLGATSLILTGLATNSRRTVASSARRTTQKCGISVCMFRPTVRRRGRAVSMNRLSDISKR